MRTAVHLELGEAERLLGAIVAGSRVEVGVVGQDVARDHLVIVDAALGNRSRVRGDDHRVVDLGDGDVDRGEVVCEALTAIGNRIGQGNRPVEVTIRVERVGARSGDRHRPDLGPAAGGVVARAIHVEGVAVGVVGLLDASRIAVKDGIYHLRKRGGVEVCGRVDVGVVGEQVALHDTASEPYVIEGDPTPAARLRVNDIDGNLTTDECSQGGLRDFHLSNAHATTSESLGVKESTGVVIADDDAGPTTSGSRGQDFGFGSRGDIRIPVTTHGVQRDGTRSKHEGAGADP